MNIKIRKPEVLLLFLSFFLFFYFFYFFIFLFFILMKRDYKKFYLFFYNLIIVCGGIELWMSPIENQKVPFGLQCYYLI